MLSDAHGELLRLHRASLRVAQHAVGFGVGDLAVVDAQEAMRAVLHEADVAVAAHGEAHVVAVRPRVVHADHLAQDLVDLGVLEAPDAPHLLAHHAGLEPQLLAVGDVLQLAAAAAPVVLAPRLDALRRLLQHHRRPRLDVRGLLGGDLGDHALAGDAELDERDAPVRCATHRDAARREARELELDGDTGTVDEAASPASAPLLSLARRSLRDDFGVRVRCGVEGHASMVRAAVPRARGAHEPGRA